MLGLLMKTPPLLAPARSLKRAYTAEHHLTEIEIGLRKLKRLLNGAKDIQTCASLIVVVDGLRSKYMAPPKPNHPHPD